MPTTDDASAPVAPQRTITIEVFRYDPEAAGDDAATAEPTFQSYEVPFQKDWVVLDALNWIKDWEDGTLSYRWSCRMGVCGSCGMMLNGVPKLSCSAFCKDYYPGKIRIEPLVNFPVERDLIVTLDGFMEKLSAVKPYIIRDNLNDVSQGEYRQTPAQLAKFKQFTMCINCTLCYAACPQVGAEPEFLGPAVIALAHRYNLDSRDQGKAERMSVLSGHAGAWECTLVGECSTVCPKHVDPAAAVQQVKIESAKDWFKKVLIPWGQR